VGATGCRVVDESVRDADARFRIGWWALSKVAFESISVRRQVGYLTVSSVLRNIKETLASDLWMTKMCTTTCVHDTGSSAL